MKLSEMLEYTASQYLDDRTDMVAGDPDYLWSDAFLVRQFNEAMRLICKAAWCIIDEGVAPAGLITLATGVRVYPLHKSVLRVLLATPTDQIWPLWRTSDVVLRTPTSYSQQPFDVNNLSTEQPGRPIAFSTDAGTRQLSVYRTPSATENGLQVALKVARKPIKWLTLEDTDAEPEVPEDYHLQLCEFAAGKALALPNVDGQQKADGRALIATFTDQCKEARRDRQRAEMEPSRWGFSSVTAMLGGRGGA